MSYYDRVDISILEGKILTDIRQLDDEIIFTTDDNQEYKMYHSQDCCEDVNIEDIVGDLQDLLGTPVLKAEEVVNRNETPEGILKEHNKYEDSYTWTFYKIDTIKGGVTIRWYGSSNGYYSESVDFEKI